MTSLPARAVGKARRIAARLAGRPPEGSTQYDDRPTPEVAARIAELARRSRRSREPIVDPASSVAVSITSHGPRLRRAHLALESIAAGAVRPSRFVLALGERDAAAPLSRPLRRLVDRGLEVIVVPDEFRVHTKYWGWVSTRPDPAIPLVVGDDDQLYPETWLQDLLATSRRHPDCIVAHRAHRIRLDEDGAIAPYRSWTPHRGTEPTHAAFVTGVSGFLMPPAFLDLVAEAGTGFLERSPRNDDVWLTARAASAGVRIVQTAEDPANYPFIPRTQHVGLYLSNVQEDANDRQIRDSFDAAGIARIAREPRGLG